MDLKQLEEKLFPLRTKTYCVLDGAAVKELPKRLYEMAPHHECLVRGELTPDMVHVAPYVALMIRGDDFSDWVLENTLGGNCGIFINTRFSITEMRNHLRALMAVHTEDGKPLIFRYYDPRVFRKFLPSCDAGQVETFFGKIDRFLVESEDGEGMLAYSQSEGTLKTDVLEL
ncbi:MAG: DUF4123 domain-containing protein [Acidobacteria bacterium]|nr:MAG: DUF4123 domain-containing protein [Acidobacteriota bacterium]REJ98974.1 MAG: DUF4123 domain-containing protein [Acidobacteriota bacterium]REK16306.1 MAG: DUF4123 domain-containing protein [Acidobacteriota bacterium]REK43987.1 MAG: DUF4123 domain-containing protein [Acidobacteriota bacterium]